MTFSIAARCATTGQFAVAVASSSPAVAARCGYARANVGAVTTQNITDPRLGPAALALLEEGLCATEVCKQIQAKAPHLQYRQFTIVDRQGRAAYFSGAHTLGVHAQAAGVDVVSAGNLLANGEVPKTIVAAFERSSAREPLGNRVIGAMEAGLAAGGEAGPIRSAGLIVVEAQAWPIADLRVDWHEAPIEQLADLWRIWQPQMRDYVQRALDPTLAPSFGVPGDE